MRITERGVRSLNATLLTLLVVATGSGVAAFGVGSSDPARWIVAVHGASGLGLLLLAPAKVVVVRRGLRRPGQARKVFSVTFAVLVLATIGTGLLHAIGGWRPYLGLLPMQLHVGAAVGAVVLLVGHVAVHHVGGGWRALLRRTDVTRRRVLTGAGVVAGSAALWFVAPGLSRRATGSHEVGSGDMAKVPVTQWLFDAVPRIQADRWRLRTAGRTFDRDTLAMLRQTELRAVLDCTGGWYTEQLWRGVLLADLNLPEGAAIEVTSHTGYRRRFPAVDAGIVLLATHVNGRPLSRGHGAPARIVAPGRRGFWWVKWVTSVEVVDEPWWWQEPFPLQ